MILPRCIVANELKCGSVKLMAEVVMILLIGVEFVQAELSSLPVAYYKIVD